jgi:hypothetical protein
VTVVIPDLVSERRVSGIQASMVVEPEPVQETPYNHVKGKPNAKMCQYNRSFAGRDIR